MKGVISENKKLGLCPGLSSESQQRRQEDGGGRYLERSCRRSGLCSVFVSCLSKWWSINQLTFICAKSQHKAPQSTPYSTEQNVDVSNSKNTCWPCSIFTPPGTISVLEWHSLSCVCVCVSSLCSVSVVAEFNKYWVKMPGPVISRHGLPPLTTQSHTTAAVPTTTPSILPGPVSFYLTCVSHFEHHWS